MSEDFTADLEHEHRLIDAGIEAYVDATGRSPEQRRSDLVQAVGLLRTHIYCEEEHLFPLLRAAGLAGPIAVMIHEHAQMWQALDQLDRLLVDDVLAVKPLCRDLLGQLATHNWKEEGVVYAQARELLPEPEQVELAGCLSQPTLPEGWVSQGLRANGL